MNLVSSLSQEFSPVDIRLEDEIMKKIKRISKKLFQSNETLNINLNILSVFVTIISRNKSTR